MTDFSVVDVPPYTIDGIEFRHHYSIDGTIYRAGEEFPWRTFIKSDEVRGRVEAILAEAASYGKNELAVLIARRDVLQSEIDAISEKNKASRAEITGVLKDNPQDRRTYFRFCGVEAEVLRVSSLMKLTLAGLEVPAVYMASAVKLIQSHMRCLLPLVVIAPDVHMSPDEWGKFFLWHCPEDRSQLQPDMLRDFPVMLQELLGRDAVIRMVEARKSLQSVLRKV